MQCISYDIAEGKMANPPRPPPPRPPLQSLSLLAYKRPKYLLEAAKKKYGPNIHLEGATKKNLDEFWSQVGYKVEQGQGISRPVEIARTVVNIDIRTHSNYAKKDMEEGPDGPKKSDDWYDDFQITSKKSVDETRSKSYNLHLENTKSYSLGSDISITSPGFFNLAGPGVTPKVGVSGSYSKTKQTVEKQTKKREESLSQGYEIVDTLKVPPDTTVKAKITTFAVTHQSTTVTRLTIDPKAHIKIRYCSPFSKNFLGSYWKTDGIITAEDLFREVEDYEEVDENITFTRKGQVSYVGEEVEVHKTAI